MPIQNLTIFFKLIMLTVKNVPTLNIRLPVLTDTYTVSFLSSHRTNNKMLLLGFGIISQTQHNNCKR
jgi:hypothetical protein